MSNGISDSQTPGLLDAQTQLVALIGKPVAHSRSPLIHNAAFRAQGLNFVYVALPVEPEQVAEAVVGLRALHFAGANVTVPHKQAVLPYLDALSPAAEAIGAVNTIIRRGDELHGDNTDYAGFLQPLHLHAEQLRGAEMLVFGAGGSARAVVYALLTTFAPASLALVTRREAQARTLAAAFGALGAITPLSFGEAAPVVRRSRLIVNTTPVGMAPETGRSIWPQPEDFSEGQIVYDLVYAPRQTKLLREAQARGVRVIGGLEMLIGQAAAAYVQWTGQPMPMDVVRAVLHDAQR